MTRRYSVAMRGEAQVYWLCGNLSGQGRGFADEILQRRDGQFRTLRVCPTPLPAARVAPVVSGPRAIACALMFPWWNTARGSSSCSTPMRHAIP